MPTLYALLKLREGEELEVYPDSLKKPTVGIGHLVVPADKLKLGDKITAAQSAAFFKKDAAKAIAAAKSQAAKAGIKDKTFIVYLTSVNFQLGTKWHKKQKKTWALVLDGKYEEAAEEAAKSAWYKQTPKRVKDFQKALRNLPQEAPAKDSNDKAKDGPSLRLG